ncbi:conserved hypothetical protein (DUF4270) [Formosa agariphila KMM 3901]|uniref:Lipoprotein n=1 Tax=Formosa agariphila (strain DSM 15362 / KCTC 12365 / LMG 23005 / KMM 3901 / M-2Alg 35-1) TaxID=1347342 RepID=T2KKH5_FORAG|nr:DUF4270 family protein [Formosa agariphila]CDF79382.1 conserved hypothetical protein (DUF4270) [Formosa agariphila KMM 3901]
MNSIFLRALLGACCFFTLLVSCETDTTDVSGEDWINNGTKVFYIDTFTVETSTYKFDSIAVSSTSNYVLGNYVDPVLGQIKASPYFELTPNSYYIDDDAVYDSIALILDYTDYYYNDTISKQKFNVYEVLETLTPTEDYFYNTSNFSTSTTSIGFLEMSPTPIREDSIQFSLDNTYGKQLFDDFQNDIVNNLDDFNQKYYGLKIVPDDSNTAIIGIGTSSILRVYYTIKGENEAEEYYFDFNINTASSFHNITSTFKNEYINGLEEQEDEVSSTLTDNSSYIQAGSGLATRIDVPFIESINTINGTGSLMDAYLNVSIKRKTNTDDLSIRDSLNVYIIDNKSVSLTQLVDYSGSVVYGRQLANEFNEDYITYTISLKYFLDLKLNSTNGDDYFLGITSQGYNSSVDRYILEGEDSEHSDLKANLELTYAIYDDE